MHLIRQKQTVNSVSYAHNEYHPKLQKRQKAKITFVLHLLLTQRHKTYLIYHDCSDFGQMFISGGLLIQKFQTARS